MKRKRRWKEIIYCKYCREKQAVKFIQRIEAILWDNKGFQLDEIVWDTHPIRPVCRKCFERSRNLRRRNDPKATYEIVSSYGEYIIQETLES
jgi:hypothetical protein